jgi:hypothetical protein
MAAKMANERNWRFWNLKEKYADVGHSKVIRECGSARGAHAFVF